MGTYDGDRLEARDLGGSYKEDLKEVGLEDLDCRYGDQWHGPRLTQILGISWQICC